MEEPSQSSWAASLKVELGQLPPLSSDSNICRVSKTIRQKNERVFTPKIVSIGPFHHGERELQPMEEYKKRHLRDFLQEHNISLEELIRFLEEREPKVRHSYAETILMDRGKFVKMILLDSVFIVEMLMRNVNPNLPLNHTDVILARDVWIDFWLVENQLPFFILEDILNLLKAKSSRVTNETLSQLAYKFLRTHISLDYILAEELYKSEIKNFVDLLRNYLLPPQSKPAMTYDIFSMNIPSAIELHQAGVQFRKATSKNLFDIQFNNGILKIPSLRLANESQAFYGNLIAFEHVHHGENLINDYFFLMDQLINTDKDVDLLTKNGIIQSKLGSNQEVANLINNLGKLVIIHDKFCFSYVFSELKEHYGNPWNNWKANLRQNYFNTPWAAFSVAGAIIILILSLIQTVFSIIK